MPRWLSIILAVVGASLLCCGTTAYFVVWPMFTKQQDKVSDQLAVNLSSSVSGRISGSLLNNDPIELRAIDLDVNNAGYVGAGIETGTEGTVIVGFETTITREGIALSQGGPAMYSGVPIVRDGQIAFTNTSEDASFFGHLLTDDGFARGMAKGINDALAEHGLLPVSLTLADGVMSIETVPRV